MKAIKLILLLSLFLNTACENNFDPKIYGVMGSTNFPKTKADYENLMLQCYIPFACVNWGYSFGAYQQSFSNPVAGTVRMLDGTSDICAPWQIGTWGGSWLHLTSGQFDNMKLYGRASGDNPSHFEKVRDISRFTHTIGMLEKATTISEDFKLELIGEARLLRGLMMYYLLHYFGPVPVIVDPELIGNLDAEAELTRPSLAQMVQYITDDLEFAVSHVNEKQSERGRYTADYARFCLMRHYLNEGVENPEYYTKACRLFTEFTGNYSLFGKGENPYMEQFKSVNNFNCETIMAVVCSTDETNGNMNGLSYYAIPPDVAVADDKGNRSPFALHLGPWGHCYNIDPQFYDTFEEKDKRREAIITSYYSKNGYWVTREDLGVRWSGFIANKFPIESATFSQPGAIPLARWADVLLMYAEAETRKNNVVVPTAVDCVNIVRERAGLGKLSDEKTTSATTFLNAILMERGHELFFEGCRKIDLSRFNKYYTIMTEFGRSPSSQYFPIPDYAIRQAADTGKELTQYFTRDNYDGPNK